MTSITLPPFDDIGGLRKGRDVTAGYQRGWGLQYGDLIAQIKADPLFQRADQLARGQLPGQAAPAKQLSRIARFARRKIAPHAGDDTGRHLTVVSELNRMNIFLILKFFLGKIPKGAIVEFGSYKGGNALFMAMVCAELHPDTIIHCFDTFEGMPETDPEKDAHNAGDFGDADFGTLQQIIKNSGLTNIELHKGLFQDTAPQALPKIGPIALNHIDCDIYSSLAYSYEATKAHMVEGGYWVIDDALYSSCIGATEAVEELIIRRDGRHCEQIYPQFVFRNL